MNRTGLFLFIAVVILAVAAYWYYTNKMAKAPEADPAAMTDPAATDPAAATATDPAATATDPAAAPADPAAAPAEPAPTEAPATPPAQ